MTFQIERLRLVISAVVFSGVAGTGPLRTAAFLAGAFLGAGAGAAEAAEGRRMSLSVLVGRLVSAIPNYLSKGT